MIIDIQEWTAPWIEGVRAALTGRQVFALIDPAVEELFGVSHEIRSLQDPTRTALTTFTKFPPNPSWESLAAAVAAAEAARAGSILAVGGGTAIDLAKLTAMALELGGIDALWQAARRGLELNAPRENVQLVGVPTTAGTGAETTRFAVLYRDGIKHSIAGDALMPDRFFLDPSLLESLPRSVIVDAGLDAVCQAMESLWSVKCGPESEEFAWTALDLAIEHLEEAGHSRARNSLAGMLVAAHFAGRAINLTTTTAPHALSYGLTAQLGLPHGRAVALLFGRIFQRNSEVNAENCEYPAGSAALEDRLERIAGRWGQSSASFPAWWESFLRDRLLIEAPVATKREALIEHLSTSVNARRLANNPRRLTPSDIIEIYREAIPAE